MAASAAVEAEAKTIGEVAVNRAHKSLTEVILPALALSAKKCFRCGPTKHSEPECTALLFHHAKETAATASVELTADIRTSCSWPTGE